VKLRFLIDENLLPRLKTTLNRHYPRMAGCLGRAPNPRHDDYADLGSMLSNVLVDPKVTA